MAYAPIQYKTDGLDVLYKHIVCAIENDTKDFALLNGEEYQHDTFLRSAGETHGLFNGKVCVTNRRCALCNLYAEYCTPSTCYGIDEDKRKSIFLEAINNHFSDLKEA